MGMMRTPEACTEVSAYEHPLLYAESLLQAIKHPHLYCLGDKVGWSVCLLIVVRSFRKQCLGS